MQTISHTILKIFLLTSLIVIPASAMADIYKWVDENGKSHYSTTPPPGVNAVKIRNPGKSSTDPEKAKQSLEKQIQAFNERREARMRGDLEKESDVELKDKKSQQCAQLKKDLKVLTAFTRVKKPDGEGGFTYLNNDERLNKLAETKKRIANEC